MTTIEDAIMDRNEEVKMALNKEDSDELIRLSALFKEEGEDEYAESLYQHAKRFEKEYWAYDENKDNQLV